MAESVIVTGASGFVGTRLVETLAARGFEVIGVTRGLDASASAELVRSDLENADAVRELVERVRPRAIFHLASLVSGSRALSAVLPTFRANLASAVHVLAAAAEFGCERVVLAGSMEELPSDDAARYPYAVAKRAASEYGRFFHRAFGLGAVTMRLGMVYGPGLRNVLRLVPHVILSQLAGTAPRLASGSRSVDWVYIDDVCDALCVAAEAPDLGGAVLDVGSGTKTSVRELAERLSALTGGPSPTFGALEDRSDDVDSTLDVDTTFQRARWRARVDLDEGLRRTVAWYRAERAAGRL